MTFRGEPIVIAVLAENMEMYNESIKHFLPGLEKYHMIEFKKDGHKYKSDKFIIQPAIRVEDVRSLRNFRLIKYGNFHKNRHAKAIAKAWDTNRD